MLISSFYGSYNPAVWLLYKINLRTIHYVLSVIVCVPQAAEVHGTLDDEAASTEAKKRKLRQDLLNEIRAAATENSTQDTATDIAMEVTNYMTMRSGSSEAEPLAFWQQHSQQFPMLSQLAKLYLSMSSASVPVEAMFSTTGLILNGKRCMLGPDKLNRISFIHDNYAYLLN